MTDVNSTYTSLKDAINICLSCIGETPVDAPNNTSTNVVLSKQIIKEVSRDVQSKGWWFNTTGSSISILSTTSGTDTDGNASFHGDIPEEARRYIAIRAARVFQSRFVGSEELHKFSFQEEQVSLAILTQAHVRNGGNATSFTAFPAELKAMGIEEVMFLQQSAEEKLLSLRLDTELKTAAKLEAEASLIADQERLVDQQVATEVQETAKRTAEKELTEAQRSAVQTDTVLKSQQALTELEETSKRAAEKLLVDAQELKVDAETSLTNKQGVFVDKQALTEVQNALKVAAETSLLSDQEALVVKQALTEVARATDLGADTTLKGKQGLLIDKQALTEVQNALKITAETSLLADQEALVVKQALTEVARATDIAADTTLKGKQGALVDAQELKTDAEAALIASQTTTDATQRTLIAAQELKTDAETTLTTKQGALVDAQELKTDAETSLTTKQGLLTDAQELKTDAETLQVDAQTALLGSQKTELDAKTAIEATAEKAFYDGVVAGTQNTYRDFAAEMRMMGIQESTFQATPAYKKVELLKDAEKLKTATANERGHSVDILVTDTSGNPSPFTGTWVEFRKNLGKPQYKLVVNGSAVGDIFWGLRAQATTPAWNLQYYSNGVFAESYEDTATPDLVQNWTILNPAQGYVYSTTHNIVNVDITATVDIEVSEVNKVMRLIGEPPVAALNDNSLASETVRLLRDTDTELQGRGWWFNTEKEVELTADSSGSIAVPTGALTVELDEHSTRIKNVSGIEYLYDLKEKSYTSWSGTKSATIIYKRDLSDVPQKYLEYLSVRVAILLTELYPQSGIDIQRLPKMEQELRAYFKDREFDEANYSIFDNYDVASRIGLNRNHSLI